VGAGAPVEGAVVQARARPRRGVVEWSREVLLSLLAAFGAVCLVVILLVTVFDLGVVVFRTGSMSPTIPAGAAALVRAVPAAEVRVGDVVTVPSPVGTLPVTHRVVSAEPDTGGAVVLHLKGDANDAVDPFDYRVDHVRRVLVSTPGAGYALVWLSDPRRMAALTVLVAVVVAWTLWPRAGAGHGRRRAPSARRRRGRFPAAVAVLVLLGSTGAAPRAAAATSYPVPENGVPGRLSLRSSMPLDERWTVTAGGQLRWQVEAGLGPREETDQGGKLLVEVVADGPLAEAEDAAQVSLDECVGTTDVGDDCAGTTRVLVATTSLGRALHTAPVEVGVLAPGERRVVVMTLDIADDVPAEQSLAIRLGLVFSAAGGSASVSGAGGTSASGAGEVLAPGADPLPVTGADLRVAALGLALATTGLVLLGRVRAARRRPR
jgi:signal peptidase